MRPFVRNSNGTIDGLMCFCDRFCFVFSLLLILMTSIETAKKRELASRYQPLKQHANGIYADKDSIPRHGLFSINIDEMYMSLACYTFRTTFRRRTLFNQLNIHFNLTNENKPG